MRKKRIRPGLNSGSYVNYDPVALVTELITSACFLSVYDVMNILQEIQDNKKGPTFR